MTKCLKKDYCNPNILVRSVVSRIINTLCEKPTKKITDFCITFLFNF